MKWRWHHVLLLVTVLLLPFSAAAEGKRFGLILPLSGDGANIGGAVRNGALLAYESLSPAAQGKLRLLFEDDKLNPMESVSAYRKLTEEGELFAVLTVSSRTSKAVGPLAEQRGTPLIAIASDFEIARNMKHVVLLWVIPEELAKVALAEIVRRSYRRIARIKAQQSGVLAIAAAFDRANEGRIELALDQDVGTDLRDFRPFLTRLRSTEKVDAISVLLMPGQIGLFARQARELGVSVPLFGFELFENPDEVSASRGALIDQWYANADLADRDFLERYRKRFPGAPEFAAANGHDAVLLVSRALERSESVEDLNTFLHTVRGLKGALGVLTATGDNRYSLPATVMVVRENGFEKLNR